MFIIDKQRRKDKRLFQHFMKRTDHKNGLPDYDKVFLVVNREMSCTFEVLIDRFLGELNLLVYVNVTFRLNGRHLLDRAFNTEATFTFFHNYVAMVEQ